ncbi:MAG TPA: hypothetical protein VL943_00960, partial [Niabella sp.]|nr:hypothetical protein [Niabella sp.]
TYTENGSARTLTGIDALNKITIAEINGAKIELNKIDFAAALPPRPESYFTFKGNKYLLTQGGFESIKPFEWDETGRYHGVYFATDGLKLQGDNYRGVGKSIYITLTTKANQIFNIPGNYSSGGWNDDATLSPDYSLIGVDISDHYSATVVEPHTGSVIDDRVTEELRIKRHGIYYEVTMKGYADLESTGPGLGLFELHYYGPLSQK